MVKLRQNDPTIFSGGDAVRKTYAPVTPRSLPVSAWFRNNLLLLLPTRSPHRPEHSAEKYHASLVLPFFRGWGFVARAQRFP